MEGVECGRLGLKRGNNGCVFHVCHLFFVNSTSRPGLSLKNSCFRPFAVTVPSGEFRRGHQFTVRGKLSNVVTNGILGLSAARVVSDNGREDVDVVRE